MSDLIVTYCLIFPMAFYINGVIKELAFQEEMSANSM